MVPVWLAKEMEVPGPAQIGEAAAEAAPTADVG